MGQWVIATYGGGTAQGATRHPIWLTAILWVQEKNLGDCEIPKQLHNRKNPA